MLENYYGAASGVGVNGSDIILRRGDVYFLSNGLNNRVIGSYIDIQNHLIGSNKKIDRFMRNDLEVLEEASEPIIIDKLFEILDNPYIDYYEVEKKEILILISLLNAKC